MVATGNGGILSTLSTGIGNFGVSYNFNAIAIALIVMSATVCTTDDAKCKTGDQVAWVESTESAIVFIGAICGQLSMGYAGDVLGRGKALALTLAIAALGAFFSAVCPTGAPTSVYLAIIFCRFMLGVGVGGVYPLSAAKAAEDFGSATKVNVTAAGWTFMFQIPGTFFPWLVAIFCSYSTTLTPNQTWRLLLGLGSIPATFVVGLLLLELHYQKSSPKHNNAQVQDSLVEGSNSTSQPNKTSLYEYILLPEVRKKLLVSGGCWFIYDVCTYGVLLFSGEILQKLLPDNDDESNPVNYRVVAQLQVIASVCAFPASIITVYALKSYSARSVQTIGFVLITIGFWLLIIAMRYIEDSTGEFFFYVLLTCCLTGGASMTTFVMPSLLYPMYVRTTMNGISAAMGKLGAAVGAFLFGALADVTSFGVVMGISSGLALIAAAITHYYTEDGITDPFQPTEEDSTLFADSHAPGQQGYSEWPSTDRIQSTALSPIVHPHPATVSSTEKSSI